MTKMRLLHRHVGKTPNPSISFHTPVRNTLQDIGFSMSSLIIFITPQACFASKKSLNFILTISNRIVSNTPAACLKIRAEIIDLQRGPEADKCR